MNLLLLSVPSGCGKSTLFNIIAGIENQTSGTILIDGTETRDKTGKTGYMLQSPLLLPWRTVEENILLGLDILGKPRDKSKKMADELLQRFGLSHIKNRLPETLSGGMKQRVALLRTILFHQDILLLDEPFGALDALTRLSCQLWLLDVWEKFQSSVLFITHDVREAILLADRILVMSDSPATIIKEIKVNLPRPRETEQLTTKKAIEIEKELISLLITEKVTKNELVMPFETELKDG